MKPEDKELLFKDLCGRLPYGVFMGNKEWNRKPYQLTCDEVQYMMMSDDYEDVPYLRPMSSMTEEEARDIAILHGNEPVDILSIKVTDEYIDIILDDGCCSTVTSTIWYDEIISSVKCFDYLNKKMFDFRGLIPKDLALSTEEFDPYTEEFFNPYED